MIRLWGRATSTNVQKALWLLAELDVGFEHVEVGGPFGGLDTREFSALNPNRTVPVLEHDGTVVWESHAVLRFLANTHQATAWYPDAPGERAYDDQWLDWHANIFWPPIRELFLGGMRDGRFDLHSDQANVLKASVSRHLGVIETARLPSQADQVPDPRLSDLPLVIGINRLLTVVPDFSLPDRVRDWFHHMNTRPAFDVVRQAEATLRT